MLSSNVRFSGLVGNNYKHEWTNFKIKMVYWVLLEPLEGHTFTFGNQLNLPRIILFQKNSRI